MSKRFLLTVEAQDARGGVARVIRDLEREHGDDLRVMWLGRVPSWREALAILRRESVGFDEIIVQEIFPIGTAAMLLRVVTGREYKYTVYLHGLDFDQTQRSWARQTLASTILMFAECVVVNSRALGREVYEATVVDPVVVYPKVPAELIAVASSMLPPPSRGTEGVRLLTVSRLVERKGHLDVLEAIKGLPDVRYTIVGDGPMRGQIERYVSDNQLTNRVVLLTNVEDTQLPEIYRAHDVFVMPTTKTDTDREGFGIVYLEASLFGLPVIASDQPGVDEAVIDGETGILVNNIDELGIAIVRLKNDAELRQRLGQQGRERVLAKPPLVSVVIPTYQHAKSLPRCLDSVLDQTYKNIEIIVVDDGSTDDTAVVLEPYRGRITYIKQENQGANPTRNRGAKEAKGEFIVFCDADVRMKPGMLAKLVGSLQDHPEASYAYSGFKFGWKNFWGVEFSVDRLRERNFIHTTNLIRRADFPGFDDSIKRLQDWDLWLTMLEAGHTGVLVPERLFDVAIEGASRIGSSWLPAFVYKLPWNRLPWRPKAIEKYEAARRVIQVKHKL